MARLRLWHVLLGLGVGALVWPYSGSGQGNARPPAGEWRNYGNDEKKAAEAAAAKSGSTR